MIQPKSGTDAPIWLGEADEGPEPFGGGELWIGQHEADQDILVLDPSESDPRASVLRLYSLGQHRVRSFPRATVHARVRPIADDLGRARALRDYAQRVTLRTAHEQALTEAHAERADRQRDRVVAAHQRHVERLGRDYAGVRVTPADHRPARVPKCRTCGIVLDDFAGMVCRGCDGVLCSCGACACKGPPAGP